LTGHIITPESGYINTYIQQEIQIIYKHYHNLYYITCTRIPCWRSPHYGSVKISVKRVFFCCCYTHYLFFSFCNFFLINNPGASTKHYCTVVSVRESVRCGSSILYYKKRTTYSLNVGNSYLLHIIYLYSGNRCIYIYIRTRIYVHGTHKENIEPNISFIVLVIKTTFFLTCTKKYTLHE